MTLDPHKGLFLPYGTVGSWCATAQALRDAHYEGAAYLQDLAPDRGAAELQRVLARALARTGAGCACGSPCGCTASRAFREALDEKLDLADHVLDDAFAADPSSRSLGAAAEHRAVPPPGADETTNRRFLRQINASKRVFLSCTLIHGRTCCASASSVHRTHRDRIDECIEIVANAAASSRRRREPVPEMPEVLALAERLDEVARRRDARRARHAAVLLAEDVRASKPDELLGRTIERVGAPGEVPRAWSSTTACGCSCTSRREAASTSSRRRSPRSRAAACCGSESHDRPSVLVKEFGKERKAGWWVLAPGDDGPLERLGPERAVREVAELVRCGPTTPAASTRSCATSGRVAGVGRGYSDDILHRAKLSPYAVLRKLDPTTSGNG